MLRNLTACLTAIGLCLFLGGCGPGTSDPHGDPAHPTPTGPDNHADSHPTEGPHGGHLVELGEEQYHAELLHDEATHTVTVHLLDAAGKQPVSGDGDEIMLQVFRDGDFVDYTLKAADGNSEFTVVDEELCDMLIHSEEIKGRLQATIAGTDYVGMIEHHAHHNEDDDHAHGDDDDAHPHETDGHDDDHAAGDDDPHDHP